MSSQKNIKPSSKRLSPKGDYTDIALLTGRNNTAGPSECVCEKKIVSIERYQSDILGPTLLFWINSWITITYFTLLKSTVISAKRTSNKNFNYQLK